jgi:enoyl-CoA hydratase
MQEHKRLAQLIGKGRALEILMTADLVDAQRAYEMGLVNHVVPMDQLITKAEEILSKIKTKSPLAIASVIPLCKCILREKT